MAHEQAGHPSHGRHHVHWVFSLPFWPFGLAGFRGRDFSALIVFAFALVFGIIGFIDDFCKVKFHKNEGSPPRKFLLQLAAAIVFVVLLRSTGHISNDLYIPFFNVTFYLPWVVYMIFAAFIIVGCVNSVNLTDGIDGLATGVTMPVMVFFVAAALIWSRFGVGVLSAAAFGGLCAFLIYNFHPAKVFMGDTGSPVSGRPGVRSGVRAGHPAHPDPRRHHLYLRDHERHYSGHLL